MLGKVSGPKDVLVGISPTKKNPALGRVGFKRLLEEFEEFYPKEATFRANWDFCLAALLA
jgi:hypothetical protein